MLLIACLLLLSALSVTPFMGKVFVAVVWYANSGNRTHDALMSTAGAVTGSGYAALAGVAGATIAASTGIGLFVGL